MSDTRNTRDQLRDRAWRAMIGDAFFRWESAVTIALTMLLVFFVPQPFPWWQWWFWLVAGALAELALVVAHVTDPEAAAQAVERMFAERYNPRDIQNRIARQRMQKALEYRVGIEQMAQMQSGAMRVSMEETLSEIDEWIAHIHRLARRMDHFESNPLVEKDRREVPKELGYLRQRLQAERDPVVRAELEQALRIKEQQKVNLDAVANNIKRADIQLDNTLASLGTIYAQMQVIDSKDLDSARTRRLRDDIHDEVAELQDTILAMDEVYSTGLRG